jgi:molybdopterin molybdotransferase
MAGMLTYEQARMLLFEGVPTPVPEEVPTARALGRILAENVAADTDLPPFRRAVMDGYALRSRDLERGWFRLRVVGDVPAGGSGARPRVGPAEAARIMTGAPIPEGADAVQRVELTEALEGNEVLIREPVAAGAHIREAGSEVRAGERVLSKGEEIGPAQVAVLASFGRSAVRVYRVPGATLVPTGDELVEIGASPAFGQIRNSNGPMMLAQARRAGLKARLLSPVGDETRALREVVANNRSADILVFSGGLSMGERDHVREAIEKEGAEIVFHRAAIKPGKPVLFARRGEQLIFGLPGNPVSTYVTFELFVRPAARRWMGFSEPGPPVARARLREGIRHQPGRLFFKPGRCDVSTGEVWAAPIETGGSADIAGFARANCLIEIPADREVLEAGETTTIWFLDCVAMSGAHPDG